MRVRDAIRSDRTSWVTTADGVRLATDVYRPADTGRHPTVVIRTSYGRNGLTGVPMVLQAHLLARRGYAVVVQDVRGRFDSGGEFLPMVTERADAHATLEWLTDQPWSDGQVGTFGVSYLGATAWATALADPGVVRGLAVGATSAAAGLPDDDGLVHLDTGMRWLQSLGAMVDDGMPAPQRLWRLVVNRLPGASAGEAYRHLPVSEVDAAVLGTPSPIWQAWADHPSPADPFWADGDLRGLVGQAPPTSHVAGWWDLFVDQQVTDLTAQAAAGVPLRAVIGPWGHLHPAIQTRTFEEAVRRFDHSLMGRGSAPTGIDAWIGGTDAWWHLPSWPTTTTWEAAVGADAPDAAPDAASADPMTELTGGATTFVADPADPTPSLGGRVLRTDAGPSWADQLDRRADVVAFTSPPLTRAVTVLGRPEVVIAATTEQGGGHLSVRLAEVDPDGRARLLADGYRAVDGLTTTVALHPLGHTFLPGQRLRLYLAGAAFPQYHRHLGTPEDPLRGTTTRPNRYRVGRGVLRLPRLEPGAAAQLASW